MKKSFQYQEHTIVYSIHGNGTPLILLHGFLESRTMWNPFIDFVSDSILTISIDLPGHGESDNLGETNDLIHSAEIIKALLQYEGIKMPVIAGHSMGGYVALSLLSKDPSAYRGVILLHSHAAADDKETKINRERTISLLEKDRVSFIHSFYPELFSKSRVKLFNEEIVALREESINMPTDNITAALRGMKNRSDQLQLLKDCSIPFLFIAGKQDSRISFNRILDQASLCKHAEVILLEDVGHMGHLEASDKLFPVIRDFVKRVGESNDRSLDCR